MTFSGFEQEIQKTTHTGLGARKLFSHIQCSTSADHVALSSPQLPYLQEHYIVSCHSPSNIRPDNSNSRDPKDGEICLDRMKPEENLVEARSGSDVQIDRQI